MTVRVRQALAILTSVLLSAGAIAGQTPTLQVLSYHDVVSELTPDDDATTITVDQLVRQLAWLDAADYRPISLDRWLDPDAELPERPVLLTFDDGYASFREHVLPLLRLFGFPAVLAPVTGWIDTPAGEPVRYGDEPAPRDRFLDWDDLREIAASGLVEIATHSHDLHRGVIGNPFGNEQPAAVTRRFDPDTAAYEDESAYRARLRDDLEHSVSRIEAELGIRPRTVVWPYGAYNAATLAIARERGLTRSLTLDPGANERPEPGADAVIHRSLIGSTTDLPAFIMRLEALYPAPPLRAAHVDLDYVYDPDPAQLARNLDRLLDRIRALGINRVLLQAFADPDGDGVADALYFPNRHLPVRADLFNRVAWQLRTRADVEVFAWMPVLAFALPDTERRDALAVRAADGSHVDRYYRLSPFNAEARTVIREIYDDLGRAAHFHGVLFHDDAMLGDAEDVSGAALEHYARAWNVDVAIDAAAPLGRRLTGMSEEAFARAKTGHLIDFTLTLADTVRAHHPALQTARNLFAQPVLDPESERWFAQSLPLFLEHYDYTALMAMPHLEGAEQPLRWLERLVARVAAHPRGLERTLFELQTVDWQRGRPLSADAFAAQANRLLDAGARHVAWYPDDFISGHPPLDLLRATLSPADHPAVGD